MKWIVFSLLLAMPAQGADLQGGAAAKAVCPCGCEPDKYGECQCVKCKEQPKATPKYESCPDCKHATERHHGPGTSFDGCDVKGCNCPGFSGSAPVTANQPDPFAYLELKTYAEAVAKVKDGQAVFLYVGVPDAYHGKGSYVFHCRVDSLAGFVPGVYSCYLKSGKPMMELVVVPKTMAPAKQFVRQCVNGVCTLLEVKQ